MKLTDMVRKEDPRVAAEILTARLYYRTQGLVFVRPFTRPFPPKGKRRKVMLDTGHARG